MSQPLVAILMGSDSDLPTMNSAVEILKEFGVSYQLQVLSAHRSPYLVSEYASSASEKGIKVFIAGAGGAAHLAGVVAAHTILPVIGVPIDSSPLNGLDALLATVQMPSGIPVATVAIGKSGAKNAAILAIQILALADENLRKKLLAFKIKLADEVKAKNEKLNKI
ncbi:MAG: 5-(carboxyamino)imidazole ribonucleotide mutase [Candidatus Omnitrophica bacterium]|nr:5-(carboxyamino)imidazole ribonucleotide mutase [Candidatus Omnitrophota bacterium]